MKISRPQIVLPLQIIALVFAALAFSACSEGTLDGAQIESRASEAVRVALAAESLPDFETALEEVHVFVSVLNADDPEEAAAKSRLKTIEFSLNEVQWLWQLQAYGVDLLVIEDGQSYAWIGELQLGETDKEMVADLLGVAKMILSQHKEFHDVSVDGEINVDAFRRSLLADVSKAFNS